MKRKHQAAAGFVGALAIAFALTGSGVAQAHPDRANYVPSITITSGINCQGVVTIGWNLQRFDPSTRAWTYYAEPSKKPRMTLQGMWHNAWFDIATEASNSGGENHIRYIGKAVTALRVEDPADSVASSPWPTEALAGC